MIRENEAGTIGKLLGDPVLVLIRGAAGSGKTALLAELRREWAARGATVLHVRFPAADPEVDRFGLHALVTAFRDGFGEFGDSQLAAALAAVSRHRTPEARGPGPAVFADLTRLFGCLAQRAPAAVLLDDAQAVPAAALVAAAARQAGCTVLAATRAEQATALGALADEVLELGPLSQGQIDELIAATAGAPLDAAVAPALRAALGAHAGNPGATLAAFHGLRRAGGLTAVQGVLCLSDPTAPIALPPEHPLVRLVAGAEDPVRQLVALTAASGRCRVADLLALAEAAGWDPAACGRALDSLVAAGVLTCAAGEELTPASPALAAAVLGLVDPRRVRALHRRCAEHLRHTAEVALLAEQVALAGPALPPDPALAPLLRAEADRVLPTDPAAAARCHHAALAHAGDPGQLGPLLRLLVRTGRYAELGAVVAESVTAGGPRRELAVGAALAAVHTGVPVPQAVFAALAAEPGARAPLEFAANWFQGREPVRVDEFTAAFADFRRNPPQHPAPARDDVEIAAGRHDLRTLFGYLWGEEYGPPEHGPIALQHRIITGYHRGEWAAVLSDIRALERSGQPSTPVHQLGRLFAAEILACQGEFGHAASWLAEVEQPCAFPAMRVWADIGVRCRAGRLPEAIEVGWRGYAVAAQAAEAGNVVGLHWLLVRLAQLEAEVGAQDRLVELCALTRKWHARHGGRRLGTAELMLTGLAEHDLASAEAAVEALRGHGNQSELMRACLMAARVAEEPRPWLEEAYEIARHLGGDVLRLAIKARMREHGVTPPRRRGAAPEVSEVERRIIALIQQGLTNRQIAGAVRVSEKTVESHLTRLFAKTGCRSRLDLATASIEGRLTLGQPRSGTA